MRGDYVSPGNTPVKNEQRRTENLWRDFEFKFGSTHLPFNDFKKEKLKRFKICWIKSISKGNLLN